MKYQKKTGMSLFEQENTMESLSKMGNPLVLLKEIADFEQFRDALEKLFTNDSKKNNAGRKPIDPVFMLKVLFLQRSRNGDIGFTNLVYNMCRLVQIKRYHPDWIIN